LSDIPKTETFYNQVFSIRYFYLEITPVFYSMYVSLLTFRSFSNVKLIYHIAFDLSNNKLLKAFSWIERKTVIMYVIETDKIVDSLQLECQVLLFLGQ